MQGMHRRLLQDLESQWLEAWRVLDQAQSDEDMERSNEARPTSSPLQGNGTGAELRTVKAVAEGAHLLAQQSAPSAAPRKDTLVSSPHVATDAARPAVRVADVTSVTSVDPNLSSVEVLGGDHFARSQGTALSPASDEAATADALKVQHPPEPESGPATAASGFRSSADEAFSRRTEQQDSSSDDSRLADAAVSLAALNSLPLGSVLSIEPNPTTLQAAASSGPRLWGLTALEPSSHVVVSALTSVAAFSSGLQQVPSRGGIPSEHPPASTASSYRPKVPPPASDALGPQRIMLRELSDHEVLASMRDAILTPTQSQFAAQGLARALMEAGYARVQVVVNGKPALNLTAISSEKSGDQVAEVPPSTDSPDKHHGNQFR